MEFAGDTKAIIEKAISKLNGAITQASEGDLENPLDPEKTPLLLLPLNQLRTMRDASKKSVGIDAYKQQKYDSLQRTITQQESGLKKLEAENAHANGANERRNTLLERRRNEYVEVFKTFAEEQIGLEELYRPLRKTLNESKGTLGKLAFIVEREVKLDEWVTRGEELLDLRRDSRFRGHGKLKEQATAYLLGPWRTGTPEDVGEAMHKFRSDFQDDFKKAHPEFKYPAERRARTQEIHNKVRVVSHHDDLSAAFRIPEVRYKLLEDGTGIEVFFRLINE